MRRLLVGYLLNELHGADIHQESGKCLSGPARFT